MRKKRTLLTILFSILMIALPVSAFATSGWFTLENNTGHTIAIANFADKEITSTDEMYISLQERDTAGKYIEMHEIRFADYGSPFGNYLIDKIVPSTADKATRATGFVLEAKLYTDKNCTQEITSETNKLTSDNKGLSVGGTTVDNNFLKIDKAVINKITDEFGQPYRGEAYMVFTAEKYLYDYVDGNSVTQEEKQTLTLRVPIVIADRVIDEYSDFAAIKEYAHAASLDGTVKIGGATTTYNSTYKTAYDAGNTRGYKQLYVGYYVMSQDVDCGDQHTGIGYWKDGPGNCGMAVNSVFDGRGYALINTDVEEHAGGLFSVLANSTVRNLTVLNAKTSVNASIIATAFSNKVQDTSTFRDKGLTATVLNTLPNFNLRYTDASKTATEDGTLIENVYVYGTIGSSAASHTPTGLIAGKANWGTVRNCIAVLDNHELEQGPDYSGLTKDNTSTFVPTVDINTNMSSAGILLAYTNASTTVQDCIGINLKVGSYKYGWIPAINDYYTERGGLSNSQMTSRLRYPNSSAGLNDKDYLGFGGWYEHSKENDIGILANTSQYINRVFGIMGWESYAKWYYRMQTAGRFDEGGDCHNLYKLIRNLDDKGNERCINWKAYVDIDNDDPARRKTDTVNCKVPITPNQTAQDYFRNNVSAAKTTTVDGETVVEDEEFILKLRCAYEPGGTDSNAQTSTIINGGSDDTYRDYYTLYTGVEIDGDAGTDGLANYKPIGYNNMGYLRRNDWIDANSNTLVNAHNIAIEDIYRDYLKDNNANQNIYNKWSGYTEKPYITTNGRVIEFDAINRGSKAIVRARSMLDLDANGIFTATPAGEDDILTVYVLDNSTKDTSDIVTLDGTTYVDTQDETIIRYSDPNNTNSTPYYQNFITIDFLNDYVVPPTTPTKDMNGDGVIDTKDDGIDTAYHGGLQVWRYSADIITVTGVQFEVPSGTKNTYYTAGQKVNIDFEWQDNKLTVYDKDRNTRYPSNPSSVDMMNYASPLTLFNPAFVSDTGALRYLYVTAHHHFDGKGNGGSVIDAEIVFKVPITLCTKIFTNQTQISNFFDYVLMDDYLNRANTKPTGNVKARVITGWASGAANPTWDGTTTKEIDITRLLYRPNYGGYYTLGADIDMRNQNFERFWGWDITTWCLGGNYMYHCPDGYWYTSTSSYGGVDYESGIAGVQNGWTTATDSYDTGFIGTLDGRGYIVKNLKTAGVQGWFGVLGIKGTVKNLTLVNTDIQENSALLSQHQYGRYENIYVHISSIGSGSKNNPVGVFSAVGRGDKAVNLCNFVQVDEYATVNASVRDLRASDDTNKTGIDWGVEWDTSYTSIIGSQGNYANMNGIISVGGGITFFQGKSPCWFQCGDIGKAHGCTCTEDGHTNDAILIAGVRRTANSTVNGLNIGGGIVQSTWIGSGTRKYHYNYNNAIKSADYLTYFNDIWNQDFWTLDVDKLPIPKRLMNNTGNLAIKFQDVAIGETTAIGFADTYYAEMVDNYAIESYTGGAQLQIGEGKDIYVDSNGNITLSNNVPEGTTITVSTRLQTDQTLTIVVTAANIDVIDLKDIFIDKATSNYTLDLGNLDCIDGIKSIDLPIEVRDMYIDGLRCVNGTHYTIDENNAQKIIIDNDAYLDYKQPFVCTIKNGNPVKLTRVQGTIYFYDLLIKNADDLDAFLPMSQKKLGGVANKTWMGTYLLANDIDYNINPFDAQARKYGVKFTGIGDTRYSGGAFGFGGIFDGLGHSINGLVISSSNGSFVGVLAESGMVCNTNFINARLTSSRASLITSNTAAAGTIQDCYMHVYVENSFGIITSDNYAQMRIRRCIVEVAQTEGSSQHILQSHFNADYGTYDETYIIGNVKMANAFGTVSTRYDKMAIYPTYDDFLSGNYSYCGESRDIDFNLTDNPDTPVDERIRDMSGDKCPKAPNGNGHPAVMTNWETNSEGFWSIRNGIPVPTELLAKMEDGELNRPNANFVPPSTLMTENTTQKLEIFNDCYAKFAIDDIGSAAGATISNHYLTVPLGCPDFKINVTSYVNSKTTIHSVYITDIINVTANQLDDVYMPDASEEIVIKLHDSLYKNTNGVGEHDKVVFQTDEVRIETDFHGSRRLANFEYHDTGYEENGYSFGKVLVLNKHDLNGITYGEVRVYVTYYVYTSDTTFDGNGNILTGDFKKIVNITVPFNLITAKIGTATELDRLWNYALTPENSESYDGIVTSYGGYFVLTDNIVYDKDWVNSQSLFAWTQERQNAGGWNDASGFKGIIDGKGYVIEGLTQQLGQNNGMFGCINYNSIIRNIGFVKSHLKSSQVLFASKGGGKFENIYVQLDSIMFGTSNNGTGVFISSPGGTPSAKLYLNKVFVEVSPATGTLGTDYFTQDSLYKQNHAGNESEKYYTYSGVLGTMKGSQIHNTLVINRGFADYVSLPNDNSFYFPTSIDQNVHEYNLDPNAGRHDTNRSDLAKFDASKLEALGSTSYSFSHRFTTDANSQGGVVPAPTYATTVDPNDPSKTIANLDSAFVQNFTSDSVWTTDAYGLPIFKQLAFNGESLDIGIVSPGGTYTLALSNKVITRITSWSLPAPAPSGVSIVDGQIVIANTVAPGTSISVVATTIYGSKTFTFTVA